MVNYDLKFFLVLLISFLIMSITPVAACEYSITNTPNLNQTVENNTVLNETNTTHLGNSTPIENNNNLMDDLVRANNNLFIKIDFITFLIYQCFGIRVTVHKLEKLKDVHNVLGKSLENGQKNVFIVTDKNGINFYNLIDGDSQREIYVFEKSGKNIVTDNLKKLGCTNLIVVVNSKDVNMSKAGNILNYMVNKPDKVLKELFYPNNADNCTKTESINILFDYSKWVCLNLMQFSRLTPSWVGWEELKTGMISFYSTNQTDYKSITTALVVNKTANNITIFNTDDGKQYLLQKDSFMRIYTGISLKQIENTNLPELNMTFNPEKEVLSQLKDEQYKVLTYTSYLLAELFRLNLTSLDPKNNSFVNACWISINLYKTYGIKTTIKNLSLNEVRDEYHSHTGMLMLLKDDNGYFYYAPIINVYENSFDVQIGESTVNLRDWELNYSGMVLIKEGNDNIIRIAEYSNLNLENIDPINKKRNEGKPSNGEIAREWAKINSLNIINIGLNFVVTTTLVVTGVATIIVMKSSMAAGAAGVAAAGGVVSSVLAPFAVVVVVGIVAIAAITGIAYGIFKLVKFGKKKHKISKLKKKYKATKI